MEEKFDVKYMAELVEYWNAYNFALINEIFTGVAINLGMSSKKAYKLAKQKPGDLQKANFFSNIFDKFKIIFKHKVPKFRYKKKIYGDGKPMTPEQWDKFNKSITDYWQKHANKVAEDIGIKSFMLGRETTNFRKNKKPYKNKSLYQIATDQFDGDMPKTIKEAYQKYDFKDSDKKIIQKSQSSIAMYVADTADSLKDAIRKQIQSGIEDNKSPIEVASDLYWNVEKGLVNKYTAESLRKNWNRISVTEMASVYEAGILAPYEAQSMESMKDPSKAVYFVRTGGTCSWCQPRQGTIVRLVPSSIVTDTKNDSLQTMGIKDPNTDIAIWPGKNNIGLKQPDWMIACPAHPHNTATFQPIDLEKERYNPKTDDVERQPTKDKFIPPAKDYSEISKEEKESRRPKFISSNIVEYNKNRYEAVGPNEYNQKLDEWRKNKSKPIPVNTNSPSYVRIFEEAEKNK